MSRVLIVPIPKEGPRGDRDLQRHPYNDYEVHVLGEGERPSKKTLVHEVDGYNHWHSTIEPESQTKAQAQKYGERLAKRLGVSLEWAGEDCEAWTVSMEVIILAKDEAQALELFEQRRRSGEIAPRAYQKRR